MSFSLRGLRSRSGLPPTRGVNSLVAEFGFQTPGRSLRTWGTALETLTVDRMTALAQALRQRIGEDRYHLWFADKTHFNWRDDLVEIGVPNLFYQEWLGKKFSADLAEAVASLSGVTPIVRFIIDPELFQKARQEQGQGLPAPEKSPPAPAARAESLASPLADRSPRRSWRRFDDFVAGACNRVAHAAALSTAETPGQGPNPLVLHGPVGTGKTHLLEAVATAIRERHPQLRVCFLTAEDFTNRFLASLRGGKMAGFRRAARDADVFLLDDLQFLAKKNATQEEFLHSLDALVRCGRQAVVTLDCHPRLAEELQPELVDRLLGGASWGLLPPDSETRRAILRKKSLLPGQEPWPPDVLDLLAEHLRGNVRELEGALHSVRHWARVNERPIDLATTREALSDLLRHSVRVVHLEQVDQAVCEALGLEGGSLRGKERNWKTSHPRMLAIYLARKHTRATYSEIGQHFGGRNHSTVVAGEKKVRHWLSTNATLKIGPRPAPVRDVLDRIERELDR